MQVCIVKRILKKLSICHFLKIFDLYQMQKEHSGKGHLREKQVQLLQLIMVNFS